MRIWLAAPGKGSREAVPVGNPAPVGGTPVAVVITGEMEYVSFWTTVASGTDVSSVSVAVDSSVEVEEELLLLLLVLLPLPLVLLEEEPEVMEKLSPLSGYPMPLKEQTASAAVSELCQQRADDLTPTGGTPARLSLQFPGVPLPASQRTMMLVERDSPAQ